MSIFLHASGEDASFDNERIRLTIETNFIRFHPPWRDRASEYYVPDRHKHKPIPPNLKLKIIEQGIVTYHALRSNHSLIEYLRHLASKPNNYVQTQRAETGHLMLSAEPIQSTHQLIS